MATMNHESNEAKVAFADELLNLDALLPSAIDWIASHLSPGDVYDREALTAWAVAAGFTAPPQ